MCLVYLRSRAKDLDVVKVYHTDKLEKEGNLEESPNSRPNFDDSDHGINPVVIKNSNTVTLGGEKNQE